MVKCHQYWPSSPGEVMELPSSQLSVELLSEAPHERLSRLQIRKMKVKRFHAFPKKTVPLFFQKICDTQVTDTSGESPSPPLVVTHLHYQDWPDYGVPRSPQDLLALYKVVREYLVRGTIFFKLI